jgi:hypothetical protein
MRNVWGECLIVIDSEGISFRICVAIIKRKNEENAFLGGHS